MRRVNLRPGAIALALFALLLLLLVANFFAVASLATPITRTQAARVDGDVVAVAHVMMDVGDTLRVATWGPTRAAAEGVNFTLFVLPDGGGRALLEGRAPQNAYATLTSDELTRRRSIEIVRDGRAPIDGGWPGEPEGVDVVWVVEPHARVDRLASGRGEVTFGAEVFHARVAVIPDWLVPTTRALVAAQIVTGLGVVVAGVRWWRSSRAPPPEGETLSELVRLTRRAEEHLRALRDAMLALGAALALVGLFGGVGLHESVVLVEPFKPWGDWNEDVKQGFGAAYALAVLLWGAQTWRIQRELTRWRRAAATDPLSG